MSENSRAMIRGLLQGGAEATNPALLDTSSSFQGNWRSIAALIIILLVGSVANSAGVGGGAIFIPVLQSLVGFTLKDSTAISQALITAGSAVSVAINIFKRSPTNPTTCLIDFSVALALTPVVLVGVSVGVLLNSILPNWILTILLIILIFFLSIQSVLKGVNLWKQENKRLAEAKLKAQEPASLPATTLHDAAMDEDVASSLACLEGGADNAASSCQGGQLRAAAANGAAAAYNSMEGLPVSQATRGPAAALPVRKAGSAEGVAGADEPNPLQPSALRPRSASVDVEIGQPRGPGWAVGGNERSEGGVGKQDAGPGNGGAGGDSPQGLSRFLDALLGPIAEEMAHRAPEPVPMNEGSWVQRRNKSAWRMLLHSGGELGQQFAPDNAMERAWSAAPGVTGDAEPWAAQASIQRLPLLLEEPRSCQQPMMPMARPKPVQPPLPADEAGDIISRLDQPEGFRAMTNPLHEQEGVSSGPGVQQEEPGESSSQKSWAEAQQPAAAPDKLSWLARFRKRSTRFRSDLQRVPKRSVALMCVTWAIFVLLQVLRTVSTTCSSVYWILLALQLATMLVIGMCIASYMQRKVNARKKQLMSINPRAEDEAIELTPMHRPSKDFSLQQTNPFAAASATGARAVPQPDGIAAAVAAQPGHHAELAAAPPANQQQGGAVAESPANPLGETGKALAFSLSFCCFAGLVAGLLGLGGGMIIGPLLMGLKVHPQAAAATSSLMVVFSSSAALISFSVDGRVNGDYAGVYSAASIIASLVGVLIINDKVRRSGRTSIVVFMLATIMILGFCVITAFGIIDLIHDFSNGNIGAHSLC